MDANSVKQSVVDSYGKLAKATKSNFVTKLFGCCDAGSQAQKVGEKIGYKTETLAAVPEGANLGVGCGNPSALSQMKPGETVVDLGSGAGLDAFIVSKIVGSAGRVIGIDLSDDMLDLAKKNAQKGSYRNVEFVKGDIEALPLNDHLADHVISNCVINLSMHKDQVYREAYRVLKPGGRLSVSDIVLTKELPAFVRDSLAGHVACVAGAEELTTYLQYVRDAGFKDVQVVATSEFPLELMLTDPQVLKVAEEMNFNLNSAEAKEIAGSV